MAPSAIELQVLGKRQGARKLRVCVWWNRRRGCVNGGLPGDYVEQVAGMGAIKGSAVDGVVRFGKKTGE